jgi:hypothetical protein
VAVAQGLDGRFDPHHPFLNADDAAELPFVHSAMDPLPELGTAQEPAEKARLVAGETAELTALGFPFRPGIADCSCDEEFLVDEVPHLP